MKSAALVLSTALGCALTLLPGCKTTGSTAGNENARTRLDYSKISSPAFFPILPWDPHNGSKQPFRPIKQDGLESIAECHFNMAGFVLPKDLPRCERLGLGALVLPSEKAFTSFAYTREWRNLSDAEIDRRVKAMVDAGGSSRAIAGYFIMDEPGAGDFPALGKAVAAVKKHAPGKLAYINLFPDYATIGATNKSQLGTSNYTEYLERFIEEVRPQAISYDNYMVEISRDLANPDKAASYYRNLLEVRRVAQKHNLPFLNIVTGNQIRPFSTPPSPANLQFQAYTTLAAGARGVTWFTYYQRGYRYAAIDADGRKTQTWAWLREVNRQVSTLAPVLCRLTSTGVFFTAPGPLAGLPSLPGEVVHSISSEVPMMAGEFKSPDGKAYVMVVNLSLEKSAQFKLDTVAPFKSISIVSTMDGSLSPFDQQLGLWLTAGQGALLEVQ